MSKKSIPCAICGAPYDHVRHSKTGRVLAYHTERFGTICHVCYLRVRARLKKNPRATDQELRAPSRVGLHDGKTKLVVQSRARGLTIAQTARKARVSTNIARRLISKHTNSLH